MRKLVYGLAALVLLVVLAVIIAAISLNRIIAANRGAILARVQDAVGRPVRVNDIRVRIGAGLGVGLTQVEIGEDPEFGDQPFLQAGELTARLKLWPLLRRRLEVGQVILTAPAIHVIRAADGRWNYQSLGSRAQPQAESGGIVRVTATGEPVAAGAAVAFSVESITIDDGLLRFTDRSRTPPAATVLQHINLRLRDVSQDRPITFQLRGAADGDQENVQLNGTVGPLAQRARLPLMVQGTLGPFAAMNTVIDQLDLRAIVTESAVEMERLNGNTLGGRFVLTGSYGLSNGGAVRLAGELRDISMRKLLAVRGESPSHPIDGRGALQLDVRGATGAALLATLTGTARVDVSGGAIRDFNLVSELLDRVSGLPALARLVSQRVKPKYSRLFTNPDTRFERMQATLRLADGRAATEDLTVTAEDFGVRAAGWFGFDRRVDMTGMLRMSLRFSGDVTADVKEAKYVVDEHGQIAIPFTLRGKLGEVKPIPDPAFLAGVLERAVTRGAAGKLIDKLLGTQRPKAPPGQEKPADLLERGLRDLLGR